MIPLQSGRYSKVVVFKLRIHMHTLHIRGGASNHVVVRFYLQTTVNKMQGQKKSVYSNRFIEPLSAKDLWYD